MHACINAVLFGLNDAQASDRCTFCCFHFKLQHNAPTISQDVLTVLVNHAHPLKYPVQAIETKTVAIQYC